jgi:receptor expression-enhancing protein 1/2/3/4
MVSSLLARCIIVTIGTLYPAYRSYKSLINSDLREVVTCLRYWIVFAIFNACEAITDIVLSWFPFYYWIKIAIILWIVSPAGSTFLYKRFIQPLLKEREQEIDQLLEHTKQRSYSALLDLTNKGFRYASNVFLNTAVLGQSYLGEHLKRSLSTSDINTSSTKNSKNPPATLYEESEEETDPEFTNRLKEDRKYLAKGTNRRPLSHHQQKPQDSSDNPSDEYEISKVMTRKTRNATNGNISKRQMKGTKPITKKSAIENEPAAISSNETDEEVENIRNRT